MITHPAEVITTVHQFLVLNILDLICLALIVDGITTAVSVRFRFINASPSMLRLTERTNAFVAFLITNGFIAMLMYTIGHEIGMWFNYSMLLVFTAVTTLNLYQVFKSNPSDTLEFG